jgi:YesN/AraC family two-component response regulator
MVLVLIDDEEQIVKALSREIRLGYEPLDFEVVSFTDPRLGLEYVTSHADSVFLVVSDLSMPGIDGADLLDAVHASAPQIALVLLTGYSDQEAAHPADPAAVRSRISKPWNQDELFETIRKARESRRERQPSAPGR